MHAYGRINQNTGSRGGAPGGGARGAKPPVKSVAERRTSVLEAASDKPNQKSTYGWVMRVRMSVSGALVVKICTIFSIK
jgi:hypothetical protein